MLEITHSKAALKALHRMAANRAALIRSKIEQYAADQASQTNDFKRLTGSADYRLRVGNDRVIFSRSDSRMDVKIVRPRSRAYR